jgi:Fe2+ or Zn2+ uptake regulation protein
MEAIDKIREAGLKLTPQRKAVYEAMMELRHAPIEAIISCVQSKDKEITLDSFYKAGLLSQVYHPQTNKCYYDITVHSHHHLFYGQQIVDYEDPELTQLIQQHLEKKNLVSADIEKIQVQITVNKI